MQRSLDQAGSKFQSIGSKLTAGISVPLAGAGLVATKFASDFEATTTKLVTLSGVSAQQMQKMRQAVLDLAPTVGIGPNALAEALLVVTSTGFEGAEAMNILAIAAKSSAVGMGETKDVARALTAAISAYGSENLTAARAGDILHATVVAGGAEATELAGEIGRVVGVAANLGVSFEEVGAFIATYTRLGISASEATTGLSGVLNTILAPSKEAKDALSGIGLSADMLRQMVAEQGLGAALGMLVERLHGNAEATGALFGNVRALAGVMGTAGVQGAGYIEILDQIKNSSGNLNAAFEETKKTFAFQWAEFKAQAEKLAITLGTQLLPAMTSLLAAAKPVGEWIAKAVQWFAALPQPVQTTVIAFLGFLAALGPVAYAFGTLLKAGAGIASLVTWVTGLGGAGGTLAAAWTSVMGVLTPLGGIIGALVTAFGGWAVLLGGALIAGVIALGIKTGVLQSIFSGLWTAIGTTVTVFADLATIVGKGVYAAVSSVWNFVSDLSFWGGLITFIRDLGHAFADLIPDWVKNSIGWAWGKLKEMAEYAHVLAGAMGNSSAPKAPTAPGMFSGTTQDDIFKGPKNVDDFAVWGPSLGTSPAVTRSKEEVDAAKRAQEAWKKVNDEISGKAAIGAAKEWMKHLADVGGTTKITEQATKSLHDTLGEALKAYALIGKTAPKAMVDTWVATMELVKVVDGLQPGMLGAALALPTVPTIEIPVLPKVVDGWDVNFGESLALPQVVATRTTGPFREAFTQLGKDLPDLIFGALKNGAGLGGVMAAVAGGIGQQFSGQFNKALEANGGDFSTLSIGTKALGYASVGIGSAFAGYDLGKSLGPGKGALAGAANGAAMGSVAGPWGMAIGAGVGAIAGYFGGKKKEKEAREQMEEQRAEILKQYGGMEKLKTLADSLHVSLGNAFTTKKPEEFRAAIERLNTAIEAQKIKMEGISEIMAGVNARGSAFGEALKAAAEKAAASLAETMKAQGIDPTSEAGKAMTTQSKETIRVDNEAEFNRVGAMALGGFAANIANGGGALATLTQMKPVLDLLNQSQAEFNFNGSEMVQRLLEINNAVNANLPAFQALEADGQILNGMVKANWADMGLFAAASSDVAAQIEKITANGMPMAQALAMNQPVLQSLWEAQDKLGLKADAATQALIDQAVQQGIVGPQMKDVNEKILMVLTGIADVLGAKIPAALAGLPKYAEGAADGMNAAFGRVRPPSVDMTGMPPTTYVPTSSDGYTGPTGDLGSVLGGGRTFHPGEGGYAGPKDIPELASGGLVNGRTLAWIGEAGPELVVPLSDFSSMLGKAVSPISDDMLMQMAVQKFEAMSAGTSAISGYMGAGQQAHDLAAQKMADAVAANGGTKPGSVAYLDPSEMITTTGVGRGAGTPDTPTYDTPSAKNPYVDDTAYEGKWRDRMKTSRGETPVTLELDGEVVGRVMLPRLADESNRFRLNG